MKLCLIAARQGSSLRRPRELDGSEIRCRNERCLAITSFVSSLASTDSAHLQQPWRQDDVRTNVCFCSKLSAAQRCGKRMATPEARNGSCARTDAPDKTFSSRLRRLQVNKHTRRCSGWKVRELDQLGSQFVVRCAFKYSWRRQQLLRLRTRDGLTQKKF